MPKRVISIRDLQDDFSNVVRMVSPNISYEVKLTKAGRTVAFLQVAQGESLEPPINEMQALRHLRTTVDQIGQRSPVRIDVLGKGIVELVAA